MVFEFQIDDADDGAIARTMQQTMDEVHPLWLGAGFVQAYVGISDTADAVVKALAAPGGER
jgi:hypothetical protein